MRIRLLIGSLIALVGVAPSLGQTPLGTAFTYQGQLKQQGSPLTELVDMRFALFDSDSAVKPIAGPLIFDGQGRSAVQVANGLFTVELDFGAQALQQGGQWLEIEVRAPHDPKDGGLYTPLTPRQRLTAAPFALSVPGLASTTEGVEVAGDIHAMGEIAASAYTSNSPFIIKVNPLNMECARFDDANCNLGVGTPLPQAKLHVGGVAGQDGIMFPDGTLQTSAAIGGGGDSIWSLSGVNAYYNAGKVGVGTSIPDGKLHVAGGPTWTTNGWLKSMAVNNAAAIELGYGAGSTRFGIGSSSNGLYFFRTSTEAATDSAHYFMSADSAGRIAMGDLAGSLTAKLDIFASGAGAELLRFSTERPWVFRQIYSGPSTGLQLLSTVGQKPFEITSVDGYNVATFFADGAASRVGIGTTSPRLDSQLHVVSANNYTGYFENNRGSGSGTGVHSEATSITGQTYGGYFQSRSTSGYGVYAFASANSGTTYAVYGQCNSGAASAYGVWANGNMGASGVKPFRIDHPDDPANKYLLHYAAESPEVINFYRGTVVLDGAGEAVVELPHYFAKINKTPSYQLTAVGAPMPMLHVAEEINEAALSAGATAGAGVAAPVCTFRIAGGAPGAKVSWEVKAVRNDLWVQNRAVAVEGLRDGVAVQTRAMPVEVEKEGVEKGTYQHPELYGLSAEMGMNYNAEQGLDHHPEGERASSTLPDAQPQ